MCDKDVCDFVEVRDWRFWLGRASRLCIALTFLAIFAYFGFWIGFTFGCDPSWRFYFIG